MFRSNKLRLSSVSLCLCGEAVDSRYLPRKVRHKPPKRLLRLIDIKILVMEELVRICDDLFNMAIVQAGDSIGVLKNSGIVSDDDE